MSRRVDMCGFLSLSLFSPFVPPLTTLWFIRLPVFGPCNLWGDRRSSFQDVIFL